MPLVSVIINSATHEFGLTHVRFFHYRGKLENNFSFEYHLDYMIYFLL